MWRLGVVLGPAPRIQDGSRGPGPVLAAKSTGLIQQVPSPPHLPLP